MLQRQLDVPDVMKKSPFEKKNEFQKCSRKESIKMENKICGNKRQSKDRNYTKFYLNG